MAGYKHSTEQRDALTALSEQHRLKQQAIREIEDDNQILRNLIRENQILQQQIEERLKEREHLEKAQADLWKYRVSPSQRARLDKYKAWRAANPDTTPTVYGGREGLEAATQEIEEYNARKRHQQAA